LLGLYNLLVYIYLN